MTTGVQPAPAPTYVSPPIPYPYYPYLQPLQSNDTRTPKQRCWDNEIARVGGNPTDLDRRAIDLKCSQH